MSDLQNLAPSTKDQVPSNKKEPTPGLSFYNNFVFTLSSAL